MIFLYQVIKITYLKQVKQILGTLEGGRFVELLVAIFLFGPKRTGDEARFYRVFPWFDQRN